MMLLVEILISFGIAMLYSTTADMYGERILTRQFVWMLVGTIGVGVTAICALVGFIFYMTR